MGDQLAKVKTAVTELDLDAIAPGVQAALDDGEEPALILANMADGMTVVGGLFEKGE
jgi:methanogenic corrinoid protein MtbC1